MAAPTAIVGATALVGNDLRPVDDAAIVIRDERVISVGRRRDIPLPERAQVVDGKRLTIAPGFIDAHVHIGFFDPIEVLAGGVTQVRDLGWPPAEIFTLARRSRRADFAGPDVVAAGQILTPPGGYPTRAAWAPPGTGLEVPDRGAAEDAVDAMAAAGACVIKVALNPPAGPSFELPVLRSVVEAAHSRGLRVTAHVFGLEELHKALDAGVDELAHMLLSPEPIPDATIARMVAHDMVVVPTLAIFSGAGRRIAIENLRRFLDAGGWVVYGTDLGNAGPRPGIDPTEVNAMSEAGMTAREILLAATSAAAHALGWHATGALEQGAAADLVAFRGDAPADTRALTRVAAVWRRGRLVERSREGS